VVRRNPARIFAAQALIGRASCAVGLEDNLW
jgi:hypothetical protein